MHDWGARQLAAQAEEAADALGACAVCIAVGAGAGDGAGADAGAGEGDGTNAEGGAGDGEGGGGAAWEAVPEAVASASMPPMGRQDALGAKDLSADCVAATVLDVPPQ